MPRLPSGRYAEIMPDRARYHAARIGLRVKDATPHTHLYPLVDILFEHPQGAISGGKRFAFTGHTLGDIQWLRKWPPRDREFFLSWIREAPQVRVIEQARRRLLADTGKARERAFDYPECLYSPLRTRVERLNLPRATAEQWRRTLLNLRNDGISQEELAWSGVLNLLEDLPADRTVDQAVIADAMDFSAIRPRLIQELVCGQSCNLSFRETAQKLESYQLQMAGLPVRDEDIGVIRFVSDKPSYKIGVLWPDGRALNRGPSGHWFVLGPYGEALKGTRKRMPMLFETQEIAVDEANSHAVRTSRASCDLTESARYDYMSLHGGEQYREWLVTLPEYAPTHFTGHFFERNVLAHVRTKVRQTRSGERILFIEELQSDWHQALARRAVRGAIPRAPFRKEWAALAMKLMLIHAARDGLDGIAWTDAAVHELRYDRALPSLRLLYDKELHRVFGALAKPWGLSVGRGQFDTRSPWLHAVHRRDAWRVEGGAGKFSTRTRFNKHEALALIDRHSKAVTLSLPMFLFNDDMRAHICAHGLPLFGSRTDCLEKG